MNFKTFLGRILAYFKEIWFLWLLAFTLDIITLLVIYFKIHPSSRTLALHYNVLIGVDWYDHGNNIYFLPMAGLIIIFANLFAGNLLRNRDDFFNFLAASASLAAQVILLSAVLFLTLVN